MWCLRSRSYCCGLLNATSLSHFPTLRHTSQSLQKAHKALKISRLSQHRPWSLLLFSGVESHASAPPSPNKTPRVWSRDARFTPSARASAFHHAEVAPGPWTERTRPPEAVSRSTLESVRVRNLMAAMGQLEGRVPRSPWTLDL